MKKKIVILVAILALIFGGVALGFWLGQSGKKSENLPTEKPIAITEDAKKFKKEYPGVAESNSFVYKTPSEIIKLLESGTGLIYFGFPECPWCQKYVAYLDEVVRAEKLDKVYYLNIREIRSQNKAEYQRIVELMKAELKNDENGQPRVFVPNVVAVNNGKIVEHDDTSSLNTSADGTPDEWWTDTRVKELKDDLVEMVRKVKSCESTCNT